MTRKDYEVIAKAINASITHGPNNNDNNVVWQRALAHLVGRLEVVFEADNPRFDAEKFSKACGIPS